MLRRLQELQRDGGRWSGMGVLGLLRLSAQDTQERERTRMVDRGLRMAD